MAIAGELYPARTCRPMCRGSSIFESLWLFGRMNQRAVATGSRPSPCLPLPLVAETERGGLPCRRQRQDRQLLRVGKFLMFEAERLFSMGPMGFGWQHAATLYRDRANRLYRALGQPLDSCNG